MCYNIRTSLEAQLKRAQRRNDLAAVEEIWEKLAPLTDLPLYHASGFAHPEMLIYTNSSPYYPVVATWGLVPQWVADKNGIEKIWNSTLNARVETIFKKPSFRNSAKNYKCIIYVDGFYEFHHSKWGIFPFYIYSPNSGPLALAGLFSTWTDSENGGKLTTFSIVTTKGSGLLEKIHNNPKLKEPRMPLILDEDEEDRWLYSESGKDVELLLANKVPVELVAHPKNEPKLLFTDSASEIIVPKSRET